MQLNRLVLFLCLFATAGAFSAGAQATTHIDILDPVNQDIKLLIAAGLVDRVIVGQQPYTRLQLASIVERAARALQAAERDRGVSLGQQAPVLTAAHAAFLGELIASIRNRFELNPVSEGNGGRQGVRARVQPIHMLSVDVTQAESPTRAIPRDNGLGSIDGTLNPLLANREGRPLIDGSNVLLASDHLFESEHFALSVRPELQTFVPSNGQVTLRASLQEAELRLLFSNVAFDIGRDNVRWGQATEGSLLNSANAPPMDLIRLSNERLWVMPSVLRYLGPTNLSIFYSALGDQQNFPDAYFVGYKASILPSSNFELGGVVYSKSGGHGSPRGTFTARIIDLFPFLDASNYANKLGLRGVFEFSDRYAGLDTRLRFPALRGTEAYAELLLNDFDVRRLRSVLWQDAGHVFGVSVPRITSNGRVAGWLEYHHTGDRYYEHFQYLSGQTLQQTLIGDQLGPDAHGAYANLDWYRRATSRISTELAVERRSNDQFMYWPVALPKFGWSRIQSRPKEWRERLLVAWSKLPPTRGVGTFAQVGYERVQNFDFVQDADRNNFLGRVGVQYLFR